ncbi:MAG: substrate-binding domain-containing protein [Desulfamplus sp.]|nr:substrate-binding domain-containing protein [Desulfamplus sp.]
MNIKIFLFSLMSVAVYIFANCEITPVSNCFASEAKQKYTIGFSQATITEPWRLLFNKELRIEAEKYPEIDLIVRDGLDDEKKQIADVEEFISRKVDVILISPKVADALTPVVNKAMDRKIPVIVLDRDLANKNYTQFIGGDNQLIGRTAGEYAVEHLGGKGKAKGNIVEIWGGMAATPAQDRHSGFMDPISQEAGIKIINTPKDGDWKQDLAYDIMAEALDKFDKIDLVYAHNDPMAYGAYLAAKDMGREKEIIFLGIDGIPAEGVKWVYEKQLTATFLYMTPGAEGIRQAIKLLKGQSIPPNVILPTMVIDSTNAEEILKNNGLL